MKPLELKQEAAAIGRRLPGMIESSWFYTEHDIYRAAYEAAHFANLYLEHMRMVNAPAQRILDNQIAFAQRLAQTPRCGYRHVSEENGVQVAGDPCGGKLVVKKRAGAVTAVDCRQCGRSIAIPKQEEKSPEQAEEAA